MKKSIKNLIKYVIIMVFIISFNCYALTVNNYNRYCEDGELLNVDISFNDVVAKYSKYGHFQLGYDFMPTGDISDPLSNEGDREMAHTAVESDTTYKIYGELDDEEMDYSFYDIEDLTSSEMKVYELQAKLDALKVGNQVQERSGFGKYNLRNGKNLIAFIKFAYDFYKNNSGEDRVGCKTPDDLVAHGLTSDEICPMELLDEYAILNSTSVVELANGFDDKFRNCINKWEYTGNKELENSDKIFETLEDIYVGLVYLYPALKVLQNEGGMNLNLLDENDRAAIFSMAYEVKGLQPITSANVSEEQLTRKLSRIGTGDLIGALIDAPELGFSVGETVYRYMIEIKHKNNPQNLARWVSEYEEIFGSYDPLDADTYDRFMKAYNAAFIKYGSDLTRQTGLDYVFFGYVEHPELFESKESLEEATRKFANHLRLHFSDSAFIRNRDNANYVAKSYMMAEKMCENTGFLDITDIYASDICLVEHSYGHGDNSTEYMLSDTQVVLLEGKLDEGEFDTDRDSVFDREEMGVEEEVNISQLLEAYIRYNKLSPTEADKLRATPTVKMYNYISNPVLPDSDFDGRGDLRDRARALDNSYKMTMDTDVVDRANYDLNVDYRYFFMDNTKYYPELSDMAVTLSNMVTKKDWETKYWKNNTETLEGTDIQSFMYHYGNEDIEVHDMSMSYGDVNVCRYAIGHHDVVLRRGKVNNKARNVITVAIGEIPAKTAELTANLYGILGDNEEYSEYHHIGYDITSSRILENVIRFADSYSGNQKVFFITGARSAGGVANLLAKKLIDKFGPSSVYAYTFNAVATINGNMIPEGSKIPNLKYTSIMNIYNDDELMVMFTSEETNMYKYGTNVHMSLSENLTSKVASAFKKVHKSSYDKDMKSKVVDILNKTFNIDISGYVARIFGFTGTEVGDWFDDDDMENINTSNEEYKKRGAKGLHSAFDEEKLNKVTATWEYVYYVGRINNLIDEFTGHALTLFNYYSEELQRIQSMNRELGNENKSKNVDYVAQTKSINESQNTRVYGPIYIPPSNNDNSGTVIYDRDLIKTIVSAAKFYINHIPTYQGKLKARVDDGAIINYENDLAYNHLADNLLEYPNPTNTDNIKYSADHKIKTTKTYENGKHKATREFNTINKEAGKPMYFSSSMGYYKWKDIINDENSYNVNTDFTGWDYTYDDCSGSIEFIINIRGNDENAILPDKVTTADFTSRAKTNNTAKILYNNGYICYYQKDGIWYESTGLNDSDSKPNTEIATKGINFLQPGDVLFYAGSPGHGEYYVGDGYTVDYVNPLAPTNDEKKKSGISKITVPTTFSAPKGLKAEGTFAWGSVIDEFPTETKDGNRHYFYFDTSEDIHTHLPRNCFWHCKCGKKPSDSAEVHHASDCSFKDEDKKYIVIWRKVR